jgi:hypothetical protein
VRPSLLALLLGAAVLYLWGLSANGYANDFYAAAAQAGSQSWKAWFFGSLDAGNSITVDKPPADPADAARPRRPYWRGRHHRRAPEFLGQAVGCTALRFPERSSARVVVRSSRASSESSWLTTSRAPR